jgi:Ti-type conjugative transfer relaxase TraA
MLTITGIGSSGAAKRYYAEYAQEQGESQGQFYDRTGELGIDGKTVSGEEMLNLLHGMSPDGERALCRNAGPEHRGGWDLHYAPDKSVSIVWANASPEQRTQIEEAHARSVTAGLDYMNEHAGYTRTGHAGANLEKAQLVAATFQHSSNRKEQPQLHTHAIVFNVGRTERDLKWRTLESRTFYQAKMASGAIYQAEMAQNMQKIGFSITKNQNGTFRLSDVPLQACLAQSERSKDIEQLLANQGLTRETAPAHLKEYLALKSRPRKDYSRISRDFGRWQKENAANGFGPKEQEQLTQKMRDQRQLVGRGEQRDLAERTLKDMTQGASTFTHNELARKIAVESIGRQGGSGIQATLRHAKESKNFLEVGRTGQGIAAYSTHDMLKTEQNLMKMVQGRQNENRHPVKETTVASAIVSRATIKPEQMKALRHVTQGKDGVSFIEGDAGTGKSYLMAAVKEVYEKNGYTVHGLSYTNKAAQNLEQGSGIKSRSVDSFLYAAKNGRPTVDKRSIVILDEAAMLDSRKTRELVRHVSDRGAKLVMVGDEKQIQPILAGQAFGTAKRAFGSERLSEIVRQKETWERGAVRDLAEGRTLNALNAIDEKKNLKIMPDRNAARRAIVAEWHKGTKDGVEKAPLILATTNAEVKRLNESARAQLKADGRLGEGHHFTTNHGRAEFASGDRIIFTGNEKRQGILNSTLATIEKIDGRSRSVTALTETGARVTFNGDDMTKFRHGYAITTHKSQGSTVDKALVMVDGPNMDREKLYVAFSRGKDGNMIFADKPTIGELTHKDHKALRGLVPEERSAKEHEIYKGNLARMVGTSHKKDTTMDYLKAQRQELERGWSDAKSTATNERIGAQRERLEEGWQAAKERVVQPHHEQEQSKKQDKKIERDRGMSLGR